MELKMEMTERKLEVNTAVERKQKTLKNVNEKEGKIKTR